MDYYPTDNQIYGSQDYWETRFSSEDEYDWLGSYDRYGKLLEELLKLEDHILIIGCGNSTLSYRLYASGFKRITNIDYSENVIQHMRKKYCECSEMRWYTMDILKMEFPSESFDIVIDKATLDTFLVGEKDPWNISTHMQETIDSILVQTSGVLKPGGKFISITWSQPHFRKRLLAKPTYNWSIETRIFGSGVQYFIYIMRKGECLSTHDLLIGQPRSNSPSPNTAVEFVEEDTEDFLLNIQI